MEFYKRKTKGRIPLGFEQNTPEPDQTKKPIATAPKGGAKLPEESAGFLEKTSPTDPPPPGATWVTKF